MPPEELRRVLEVNVVGQLVATQAFLPLLRRGNGRIVNMGSFNGRVAAPFIGPYCASKFALEGLNDALRLELAPWDVGVSLIEPGSIDTGIWRKYEAYTDWLAGILPGEAQGLYGQALGAAREAAKRRAASGPPPEVVAGAVARALTSKRPKTRYLVGWDARLGAALAELVPDRALDEAIVRDMRLPRKH
jgi:NAD(P)-dependent dehydrogenase (short-subunit alcohol dehydrogenase family)